MLRRRRQKSNSPDGAALSLDPEREVSARSCDACGRDFTLVKAFVYRRGIPHGIYLAACHEHDHVREAWIGARVGPVDGQHEPAATLVQAATPYGDSPIFGQKLSREKALKHPLLPACWEVVDFVLLEDTTVRAHVYG